MVKTTPLIDIRPDHLHIVQTILRQHLPAAQVWAYGSRVAWTSDEYSDLDLVARGSNSSAIDDAREALCNSTLPFRVELFDWAQLPEVFQNEILKGYMVMQEAAAGVVEGWREVRLGEFIKVKHGYAFDGEFITDINNENILVTPGNFNIGGGFKANKFKYFAGNIPADYILQANDLIVTMTDLSKEGDTLGYPAFVPCSNGVTYLHNQRIGKIIFEKNSLEKIFLYYFLCTKEYRNEILASATGTSIKHTSPKRIENVSFLIPPLPEQRAIAAILGALDDKIHLNNRMNDTLEATARTLFKSWFVDFDPVHAKMAGKQPFGMDAATAALFPASFIDSKLGEIPEGWRVESLSVIANFLNGLALQKYPQTGDDYLPVIKIAELRQGITNNSNRASLDLPKEYIVEDGDVLFSWSGSLMQVLWTGGRGALNQHLFKVTSNYPKWFHYYWVEEHMTWFQQIAASKATTMGHIQRMHLTQAKVLLPDDAIMQAANHLIAPLFEKKLALGIENKALERTRDYLLPKLISGNIRIRDAERFVEGLV